MKKIDPKDIKVILATDCGSTTTKAILIEFIDGEYRQTYRGEAPTTVEAPFEDVTLGVLNAISEISDISGRKLIDEKNNIIRPSKGNVGCDIYISTSSAGGGLQMMVAGVVKSMTAQSAQRAALGAGAIVMDVIAHNDKRLPHEQIQRIRHLRPDMILLSGGIDGGTKTHVVELAELISAADPSPRLGSSFKLPVIYAGNKDASGEVSNILKKKTDLCLCPNIRPVLEKENLLPAREKIHDLFLDHVMAQAPGYGKLMTWTDSSIMPTPAAVGLILKTIADEDGINAMCVDIGGATTDVFSVFDGIFNRTVSANLGMSYSISNVLAEAGLQNVIRWDPFDIDERKLRNNIKNKMIRPTTIPQTLEDLMLEQAVAREALRLACVQHKDFATGLKGVQQQRTIADVFAKDQENGQTLIKMSKLNLLVGSGGVLSHAPRMEQTALMLIDAFLPEHITTLAKDSIFMMPHLGVLTQVHKDAATHVFKRDCLINLGTCIAPTGKGSEGKVCLTFSLTTVDDKEEFSEIKFGDMKLVRLPEGQNGILKLFPSKGFDLGNGSGKSIELKVTGGTVGIIFDCRGRPFVLPTDKSKRTASLVKWFKELEIY